MRIGFTGTRGGMSTHQRQAFRHLLELLTEMEYTNELHHGDCLGADADAHNLALSAGVPIVIHPPHNPSLRAFCEGAREERDPMAYIERNHAIVDETTVLVACPLEERENVRSGTWATVRYARQKNRCIHIIYPNGMIIPEGG